MTECRCGKPTRDDAYVCDDCAHELAKALGDVPAVVEELEVTITRAKGVDYRRVGGGKGARTSPRTDKRIEGDRSPESPKMDAPHLGAQIQDDVGNMTAAEARSHLRGVLVAWVKFCADERVRSSSPHLGLPEDNLTDISRWLMWRVDGLTLHDIGPEAVDEIVSAVAHCHRLTDRPADRQYLGACEECGDGRLYARPGGALARCNDCGDQTDAEELRTRLLHELDDRLCTAAEIAHLSTYLGLRDDRGTVRKRINQWHARERIRKEAAISDEPVFRFGIVWRLLVADDQRRSAKGVA